GDVRPGGDVVVRAAAETAAGGRRGHAHAAHSHAAHSDAAAEAHAAFVFKTPAAASAAAPAADAAHPPHARAGRGVDGRAGEGLERHAVGGRRVEVNALFADEGGAALKVFHKGPERLRILGI